ncbi:hypothetical protein SYNTR_2125 [Candidatus Syntrophocurvum alkaliphilum]|uniref:Putative manganese efflux pump MntP n=1 Tax=Candidatus Syntrophocurvum alkaliphilum TaxID=2293317 RepID=A0A6I6DJD7_9FIRM|nr:manganese efflux pump MntP family protein [Candidatus Syntrophocurvum alkaliphilum]QGU00719.1 hypothetical protein SYNTR_2125 [Candidatus Syntrophocurvum alkaliphilum]
MHEQLVTIIIIAVILGADAFSLSLGMGLKGVTRSYEFKFAAIVAAFHVAMPLIGLNLGMVAGNLLGQWAAWIGALILAYIGFDMFRKGFNEIRPQSFKFSEAKSILDVDVKDTKNNWVGIFILAGSVSVDALTVGFSLGTAQMPIAITVIIMGLVAGIMTILGFRGARIFSRIIGSYAQLIGGIILLALAVMMVI